MDYQQLVRACEQGQLYYTNKEPVDANCYSYENGGRESVPLGEEDEVSDEELMGEYYGGSNSAGENGNDQDRPRLKLKINLAGSPKKNVDRKILHFGIVVKSNFSQCSSTKRKTSKAEGFQTRRI